MQVEVGDGMSFGTAAFVLLRCSVLVELVVLTLPSLTESPRERGEVVHAFIIIAPPFVAGYVGKFFHAFPRPRPAAAPRHSEVVMGSTVCCCPVTVTGLILIPSRSCAVP
jgi:hypothetical protein